MGIVITLLVCGLLLSVAVISICILSSRIEKEEEEKRTAQEILEQTQVAQKAQEAAAAAGTQLEKEYENEIQKAHSGNKLDAFNAVNNILSK